MKIGKKTKINGRPTKYKRIYCRKMIEYFDVPYTVFVTEQIKRYGEIILKKTEKANRIPMIERFAWDVCQVSRDTLLEWKNKHEEFSVAYSRAKGMQKSMIIHLGLNGFINAGFAIFISKRITDLR